MKEVKTEQKRKETEMESNLIVWSVSQLSENSPLRGHEVTGGKYRGAKPMKVYPASRVLIFSSAVFS